MKKMLSGLAAKYDALAQRERRLVAAALLGGVLLIAWSLFIDPAITRSRIAERGIVAQRAQLQVLQAQTMALQSPEQGPEAQARAELAGLKKQLSELGARFSTMESALVPPQHMTRLLESMIGHRSGLRLLSLRTLPVAPVLEKKDSDPSAAGLFKHGVEIRLEGGYGELADYLARLEKMPQKLLWSSVALSADKHPKLVLTLTVYTLSLDRTWLIV